MNLVIRNLSKTYPNGTRALNDVTLDVPQGMFGLLGRNGAGKSTLMRILATLQEPDEGSVRLGDIDVLRQRHEVRKTLGYLPQSFGFHARAKAERLLEHFAVLKGIEERGVRREQPQQRIGIAVRPRRADGDFAQAAVDPVEHEDEPSRA
jgi:ABC-type multidrug transport system ATPase subunit